MEPPLSQYTAKLAKGDTRRGAGVVNNLGRDPRLANHNALIVKRLSDLLVGGQRAGAGSADVVTGKAGG